MRVGWQTWSTLGSALVYAFLVAQTWGGPGTGGVLLSLVPVLGFIWFCEFWATWLGPLIDAKPVDRESPAWLIALAGWLILISVSWIGLSA